MSTLTNLFKKTFGGNFHDWLTTIRGTIGDEALRSQLHTIVPGLFEPLGDEAGFEQTRRQLAVDEDQAIDQLLALMEKHEQIRFRTIIAKMDIRPTTTKVTVGQGKNTRTRERTTVQDFRLDTLRTIAQRVIETNAATVKETLYNDGMIIADPALQKAWDEARRKLNEIWENGFFPPIPWWVWVGISAFLGGGILSASHSWGILLTVILIAGIIAGIILYIKRR